MLLPFASRIAEADARLAALITPEELVRIVGLIPDDWLEPDPAFASPAEHRDAYLQYLLRRLQAPRAFAEEAIRAHAQHV